MVNFYQTIKQLFTRKSGELTRENVYLQALGRLQTVCNALPQGKAVVSIESGELNLRISWDAQSGPAIAATAFSLDGRGEVTALSKLPEKEDDTVKDNVPNDAKTDAANDVKPDSDKDTATIGLLNKLTTFLKERYSFRFNILTEETEYVDNFDHHHIYTTVDSRAMNGLCLDAMEEGIACWDRDVKRYVGSNRVAQYHPFRQYFEDLPEWDGCDRVAALSESVSKNELWGEVFHRWMLALTAQWMGHGDAAHANSVAPILISTRQGMGKSTFCRMLMPDTLQRYYTDSYDLTAQGACEQKLALYGLINIDEFDKLSTKKMPLLKNLMQMKSLNIRKAYKRSAQPLERIASFIGTSNRRDLLTDNTGSRRFFCIETDGYVDAGDIDMDQVYAQLKQELLNGARFWFTKDEEAAIERHNRPYYKSNPAEDVFHATFRMATATDENARLLTAAEIYAEVRRKNPAAMREVSCTAFARLLPELGERVHTRYCNGYYVVRK